MYIAFELSMPGRTSWNGHWSGEGNRYVRVRCLRDAPKSIQIPGKYSYSFSDGWRAQIDVREVSRAEATKLVKASQGFQNYDWMIDSLIEHGTIRRET